MLPLSPLKNSSLNQSSMKFLEVDVWIWQLFRWFVLYFPEIAKLIIQELNWIQLECDESGMCISDEFKSRTCFLSGKIYFSDLLRWIDFLKEDPCGHVLRPIIITTNRRNNVIFLRFCLKWWYYFELECLMAWWFS